VPGPAASSVGGSGFNAAALGTRDAVEGPLGPGAGKFEPGSGAGAGCWLPVLSLRRVFKLQISQ
jgi:hypothetical protein